MEQKGELEASLVGALTSISRLLEQIRQNTAREVAPPPPHFPPPAPDTGVGVPMPMDAVVPDVGGNPLATGSPLLPGYASGPVSHAGTSQAAAPPAAAKAAACPGRASADKELVSIFLCYCPESVGGARPTTPANMEVPSQRQGIYTRDNTTSQVRVLSPTVYTARDAGRITSAWAPKGLAVLKDQQQQVRRIY